MFGCDEKERDAGNSWQPCWVRRNAVSLLPRGKRQFICPSLPLSPFFFALSLFPPSNSHMWVWFHIIPKMSKVTRKIQKRERGRPLGESQRWVGLRPGRQSAGPGASWVLDPFLVLWEGRRGSSEHQGSECAVGRSREGEERGAVSSTLFSLVY